MAPAEHTAKARLAFAQGWIESQGPMTPRVKAACQAAMETAAAHPDDPDVFEATLHIGRLEGTWAKIFADRETVHDHYGPAITAAYRALLKATLDVPGEIHRFRKVAVPVTDRTQLRHLAGSTAHLLLRPASSSRTPEHQDVLDVLADGSVAAEDAGFRAAHALAGPRESTDDAGPVDPGDPSRRHQHRAVAVAALGRIIGGTASDVTDELTDLADSDMSEDDMVGAIEAETAGDGERASGLYADQMIGSSFLGGLLAGFARLTLSQVDWVTAGDGRVCDPCLDKEAGNPYTLLNAPTVSHPACRCVLQPS